MTISRRISLQRTTYLPLGLIVAGVAGAALALGIGGRRLVEGLPKDKVFTYAVASGLVLILAMAWQWKLYLARRRGDARWIQREYRLHRWVGILPMALLAVHIGKPEASLLSILSYTLLLSSLSGLLNNEVVRQRKPHIRKIWLSIHLGSAALVVPLIILHMWAAFAFKGP